jgi:hypothetical protein
VWRTCYQSRNVDTGCRKRFHECMVNAVQSVAGLLGKPAHTELKSMKKAVVRKRRRGAGSGGQGRRRRHDTDGIELAGRVRVARRDYREDARVRMSAT